MTKDGGRIRLLRHTGDSANIAYFAEEDGPVWATVLRNDFTRDAGGKIVAKRIPDFVVTVYQQGVGEVTSFPYKPRRKPRGEVLPERTVTRLVREALAGGS